MALEAKHPHNYVLRLQSSGKCKAPWELFFMVVTKKEVCLLNKVGSNKLAIKVPLIDIALG
jgi:hypothetical protein